MHLNWRRAYAGMLLLGFIGSGLHAAAADEALSAAPAATAPELEAIVVSGLRESLAKSLEEKQKADVVLDSINALELGRFPDDDVADSLRHVTGVNISRTTGGEGQYVGVRGLGSQYNIVTLNNRILATDDDGRALAFDVLPADVISGADVYKSSQASALEGSIGGTVNMRTARPFDNPGLHSAARIEGNYDDMSEFFGKKASVFVSDTNEAGTLGILIGGVASDTRTRTDALNYNTYDGANPGVWPLSGPNSQPVVAECCISFGSVIDEKKREACRPRSNGGPATRSTWRSMGSIPV
jgi:TonB-dependent receptor